MHLRTLIRRSWVIYACLLLGGFATGMGMARYIYGAEGGRESSVHPVRFVPLPPAPRKPDKNHIRTLPVVDVIDIDGVRRLAGRRARVRGKIYRVGHARKSDTYFLDFGPSRSSFTAVVFASAGPAFKREKIDLRQYEGQEVELVGRIEDDPRYGLEMILSEPGQIKHLDE